MKMKKLIALMMAIAIMLTLMSGCGGGKDELAISSDSQSNTASDASTTDTSTTDTTAASSDENSSDQSQTEINTTQEGTTTVAKKKVFILFSDLKWPSFQEIHDNIIETLEANGYKNGDNIEIKDFDINGEYQTKYQEAAAEIEAFKPDLIITDGPLFGYEFYKLYIPTGCPMLFLMNADLPAFRDIPGSNISGLKAVSDEVMKTWPGYLKQITPLEDKKIGVIYSPSMISVINEEVYNKEYYKSVFEAVGITMKDYLVCNNYEEFQVAIENLNNDDEVGAINIISFPQTDKDGNGIDARMVSDWVLESTMKPTYVGVDYYIEWGHLGGISISIEEEGTQLGNMAVRVLKGEQPKDITPEGPSGYYLSINLKRASDLGIDVPASVLGASQKIYTDYNGTLMK